VLRANNNQRMHSSHAAKILESLIAELPNGRIFDSRRGAQLRHSFSEIKSTMNDFIDSSFLELAGNVLFLQVTEVHLGVGTESKEADKDGEDEGLDRDHDMKLDWISDE